jgi:hypothetical protein
MAKHLRISGVELNRHSFGSGVPAACIFVVYRFQLGTSRIILMSLIMARACIKCVRLASKTPVTPAASLFLSLTLVMLLTISQFNGSTLRLL